MSTRPDDGGDEELQSSTPGSSGPHRATGGMGVSSERVGPAGPGQEATDGVRDVSEHERDPDEETLPEQSVGNPEDNPTGIPPKAGYPSKDPRSDDDV
jgi:hypothetical protein